MNFIRSQVDNHSKGWRKSGLPAAALENLALMRCGEASDKGDGAAIKPKKFGKFSIKYNIF